MIFVNFFMVGNKIKETLYYLLMFNYKVLHSIHIEQLAA